MVILEKDDLTKLITILTSMRETGSADVKRDDIWLMAWAVIDTLHEYTRAAVSNEDYAKDELGWKKWSDDIYWHQQELINSIRDTDELPKVG